MTHPSTVADTLDAGDGWIAWTAGACPVSASTRVDVRFRDGAIVKGDTAGFWASGTRDWWKHQGSSLSGHDADIIAYRVVQP